MREVDNPMSKVCVDELHGDTVMNKEQSPVKLLRVVGIAPGMREVGNKLIRVTVAGPGRIENEEGRVEAATCVVTETYMKSEITHNGSTY